ncbi:spore germination protein, partial [Clostridium botulinum]
MKNKNLNSLQDKIHSIKTLVGEKNDLIIKELILCKTSNMEATLIYIDGLVNNQTIDRDILKPLMFNIEEDLSIIHDLEEYLCKKYISLSNTYLEEDINNVVFHLKRGKTILIISGKSKFIILDTTGGSYRNISDPINETSVRSSRESFIEKLETNISLLRRRIRDNNLVEEKLVIGRRSQTDVVLMYIDNIADKNIVADIKSRLNLIDVDGFVGTGMLEQFIEYNPYSIFPQGYFT